jgi:hypothetical protein
LPVSPGCGHNIGKLGLDGCLNGKPNSQQSGCWLVRRQDDFYREALRDLGEVAGSVIRLQRRERCTRRSRNVHHLAHRSPRVTPRRRTIWAALRGSPPGQSAGVILHYNVQPVIDIYGATQGRDLGAVSRDIEHILQDARKDLPRGSYAVLRGQVATMSSAYGQLFFGLAGAIVLIYLAIVVNFQSWLDPFITITALPGALAGIVWGKRPRVVPCGRHSQDAHLRPGAATDVSGYSAGADGRDASATIC